MVRRRDVAGVGRRYTVGRVGRLTGAKIANVRLVISSDHISSQVFCPLEATRPTAASATKKVTPSASSTCTGMFRRRSSTSTSR